MASKTPSYDINYNDKKFTQVTSQKNQALKESDKAYNSMINNSDKYYQKQIDAARDWSKKQQEIQQANTDFAIEKVEQQKDQAHKSYLKEQSGAYTDWKKQSNDYGAKAEQMATNGMGGTGYSESSQVSMYNTYQSRVATARESYNQAVLNYDNAIKDAQLQNNSKLAEIAYQGLQQELELSLQGFQYKNTLLMEKMNKRLEIDNTYYQRYQDVLAQMNTENSLAEQIRQFNENLAEDKRQFNATHSGSSGSSSKRSSSKKKSNSKNTSGSGSIDKKKSEKKNNKIPSIPQAFRDVYPLSSYGK